MADTPRSLGSDKCPRGGPRGRGNLGHGSCGRKARHIGGCIDKDQTGRCLNSNGPFTGFAPTDEALTTALEALGVTAEELLVREDWADTVKYHVIPVTKSMSTDLEAGEQKWETCRAPSCQ